MNRNRVKLCCNPYTKSIEYYRWDEEYEEYFELSERSKLSSSEYTKGITIQNKIQEIFKILQKEYNVGNTGLDVVFEGTSDDYKDIVDAQKVFCSDYNIMIHLGEKELSNATKVMEVINKEYADLESYFNDADNNEIREIISKYKNTVKPSIPICVMGLYSAGKSTFINSLIGQEILPSASDPTTARNYKIVSGDKAQISFIYKGEKIVLNFDGKHYKPNKDGSLKILADLQEIVNDEDEHTQEIHMYRALKVINDDEYNEDISDIVEIVVPFKNSSLSTDEYVFEIYDTPGSDAASHAEHFEILKESIAGQTNGLPILVTDSDSMDKESNRDLIDTIEELGNALDKTNTIIIVNKSDDKTPEVLEEKKETKGTISKWQSNRIFFVSSIIGLGSKKENPTKKNSWLDTQYHSIYKKNYMTFMNPSNRPDYDPDEDEYKQLYKYNILSDDRKREYEDSPKSGNDMLDNSGIHCVEHEISVFAKKYALYNKCHRAQEYLKEAIDHVNDDMKQIRQDLNDSVDEMARRIGVKRGALTGDIKKISDSIMEAAAEEYVSKINSKTQSMRNDIEKNIKSVIKNIWDKTKECGSRDNRIKDAERHIKNRYNSDVINMRNDLTSFSEEFWKEKRESYKSKCMEIISESSELTNEEKEFLKKYIMDLQPIDYAPQELSRTHIVKGLLFRKIDEKRWREYYIKEFNNETTRHSESFMENNQKSFKEWINELRGGLIENLAKFNQDLKHMCEEHEYRKAKRKRLSQDLKKINKSRDKIIELTKYKEC